MLYPPFLVLISLSLCGKKTCMAPPPGCKQCRMPMHPSTRSCSPLTVVHDPPSSRRSSSRCSCTSDGTRVPRDPVYSVRIYRLSTSYAWLAMGEVGALRHEVTRVIVWHTGVTRPAVPSAVSYADVRQGNDPYRACGHGTHSHATGTRTVRGGCICQHQVERGLDGRYGEHM